MNLRSFGKFIYWALPACLLLAAVSAHAGETLRGVKVRDVVRCSVSEGITRFTARDATGRFPGILRCDTVNSMG